MDRLVCGDVGFGKTEVAVRAVFKAVQDGHQGAILVPTTLLAQQHFQTFSDRVRALSDPRGGALAFPDRLGGTQGRRRTGRRMVWPRRDGTHRLLTPDVRFKRLGLLVVDEEQRFGVSHKEAIKQMSIGVDVLTLTASPIPRTLEMSLTGIRDLSPSRPRRRSASRSSPMWANTTNARSPRRFGGSCCARARSSTSTTGCKTSSGSRPSCATSSPTTGSPSRTARWTRELSSRSCSTSGPAPTTCWSARRSSNRASTCLL